jgi:hypothetical protein
MNAIDHTPGSVSNGVKLGGILESKNMSKNAHRTVTCQGVVECV